MQNDSRRGRGVCGGRVRQRGEQAARDEGLPGEAVRQGVHQSRDLHLRRLAVETRRLAALR